MLNKRNRTPSKYIVYALQLYFSGLSLRKISQQLSCFVKRNHISIWKWIQHHYKPMKILQKRQKVSEFIIDETLLKIGNQYAWIWVAAKPTDRVILDIRISFERTILVAEKFLKD
jgi:putative transposase